MGSARNIVQCSSTTSCRHAIAALVSLAQLLHGDVLAHRDVHTAIKGVVLSDEASSAPLWGASVVVTERLKGTIWTTLTNGRGEFSVDELPAGRFSVVAIKAGYVSAA